MRYGLALPLLCLGLAACNQTTTSDASGAAAVGVTPATFQMPAGAGCTGDVSRFRAVIENDARTGHVNRSVYEKVNVEIDRAAAACSAGQNAEAVRMIAATKSRFGYP